MSTISEYIGTRRATQLRQLLAVGLGGQHDRPGAHVTIWSDEPSPLAAFEVDHRRLLVDRPAAPLDRPRQPRARRAGWMLAPAGS